MIFVNKLDRERASFDRTLDELRRQFGAGVAPLELPIGEEAAFRGVADLLTDTAYLYEGGPDAKGKRHRRAPSPTTWRTASTSCTTTWSRGSSSPTTTLMERYLEGETISPKELEDTLALGVSQASVFPVVCGSAAEARRHRPAGRSSSARSARRLRAARRSTVQAGDGETEVACDPDGQPLAFVFKTVADPYVGKVTFFKVLSGTVRPDAQLTNPRTHADERLHGLFTMRGKEQDTLSEVPAGDIGAVAKLSDTGTGDTLAPKGTPVVVPTIKPLEPALSIAIVPRSKGDEDKLMIGLHRLQDEDPALRVSRNDETKQTLLSGMGETHLSIVTERLARKFGVEVNTEEVRVPYRETITAQAEAEGKYKKQTGGHGQFGVAFLRVEPLDRGAGFQFVDKIVGGAIPRQFIPAVEKGVAEAMATGGVFGFPVVDVRVTCFDGKYHPVDSSEMSFKMAGLARVPRGDGEGQPRAARARSRCSRSPSRSPTRAT